MHKFIIDPDYARTFTIARAIAWQEGYSCAAQGSFTRDLDLLIVPWTETATKDLQHLVNRIAEAANLRIQGPPTDKPHGRKSWTLLFPKFGDPRFVDLAIFSPFKFPAYAKNRVKIHPMNIFFPYTRLLKEIIMNQAQLAEALQAALIAQVDTLTEALANVQLSDEAVAALTLVQASAKALDDLNVDAITE